MKSFTLLALAAAARLAQAHSTVYAIWVNDVDQGLGNSASGYIRSPSNNDPVKDVTSSDMTCNVNNVATAKTISVVGGDKITFEWHHNDRTASDDIIASSHLGPVMTYIAPTSSNGAGDVWIKLAEDGYDGEWAVSRLIANKGKHSITLPDLAAGTYLLRPEIIALHEAENVGGAQFYMECVQIKVTSAGTKTLPAGVAIPGTYSASDPGILFNLYNGFTSYPIPGPKVWDGASGTVATSAVASASKVVSTSAPATSAAVVSSAMVVSAPAASTPAAVSTFTKAATSAPASTFAAPTTLVTAVKPTKAATSTSAVATATPTGPVAKYYQCGGINYTGATTCVAGTTCKHWNPYYYQCV
ncbi:uncharacterized protein BDZ99DRAFT_460140 [Mytilinidion resinicola]|uniref:AA9 family lytic polysaccharide monooxygenase n=1 Tax=Mytilinidion resinicola TaxID=574789 RepID=A0A6A6Z079_9PEZI|nr:uncharacterized protein BDZ99DRAFT_460140 [Mytilinidion resinicola]KAF2814491.1 hypothetical protein BDZ99DRAFT_460140 [Mytilinidion resinicola]